ncbi:MAG TPA: DUF2158 domain-containing protein [Janthinobacterium sp.]|jgi:uncharacterized protein YodC (DUF2158 family)|nr:DUF2158 domain-containing protein [Janthinobacterium sp.]
MDTHFGVGDIVQLIAGGPVMTVLASGLKSPVSDAMDGVLCAWTDKKFGYEWVYDRGALSLIRKERRLVPRWTSGWRGGAPAGEGAG